MQLTPAETKLIERLRKEERRWARWRWLTMAAGGSSFVACTACGWLLYRLVHEGSAERLEPMDVFVIVLIWTKCFMWFVIGVSLVSRGCTKWRGDANRTLLLRLLDERRAEKVPGSPTV